MQSLETKSSRPGLKSFETETIPSRSRLQKTGLETRTETKSRDSIIVLDNRKGTQQHAGADKGRLKGHIIHPSAVKINCNHFVKKPTLILAKYFLLLLKDINGDLAWGGAACMMPSS